MNAKKKSDLTSELVEFLLKEDQEKKGTGVHTIVRPESTHRTPKPSLTSASLKQNEIELPSFGNPQTQQTQDVNFAAKKLPRFETKEVNVAIEEKISSPLVLEAAKAETAAITVEVASPKAGGTLQPVAVAKAVSEAQAVSKPHAMSAHQAEAPKAQGSTAQAPIAQAQASVAQESVKIEIVMAEKEEDKKEEIAVVAKIEEEKSENVEERKLEKIEEKKRPENKKIEDKKNEDKKTEDKIESHLPTHVSEISTGQRGRGAFFEAQNLLSGAEALRASQTRITNLERERDQLREEADALLSATENLQRQYNELKAEFEGLDRRHKEKIDILEDEKAVLKGRLIARDAEINKLKKESEEWQARFQNDLRKIRVRERELEHRQEMMRSENQSLLQAKDEMILSLKRQLEKLHFEIDNFRAKSADMNARLNEFYDRNHRTVKALRLALSVLEIGDATDDNKKKVG